MENLINDVLLQILQFLHDASIFELSQVSSELYSKILMYSKQRNYRITTDILYNFATSNGYRSLFKYYRSIYDPPSKITNVGNNPYLVLDIIRKGYKISMRAFYNSNSTLILSMLYDYKPKKLPRCYYPKYVKRICKYASPKVYFWFEEHVPFMHPCHRRSTHDLLVRYNRIDILKYHDRIYPDFILESMEKYDRPEIKHWLLNS